MVQTLKVALLYLCWQEKTRILVLRSGLDTKPNFANMPPSDPSNPSLNSSLTAINEIDYPIAQHKGIRSCTQHPISNFVS